MIEKERFPKVFIVMFGHNMWGVIHCTSKSSHYVHAEYISSYNLEGITRQLKIMNGADVYYDKYYMNPNTIKQLQEIFPRKRFHETVYGGNEWYVNIIKSATNKISETFVNATDKQETDKREADKVEQ